MPVSREDALVASLGLTEDSKKVANAIPVLIEENPDLPTDVVEILMMLRALLPLLSNVFISAFERALEAEDALDKVQEMLDKITVED